MIDAILSSTYFLFTISVFSVGVGTFSLVSTFISFESPSMVMFEPKYNVGNDIYTLNKDFFICFLTSRQGEIMTNTLPISNISF